MRWDRLTFTALGGVAAFLVGIGLLLGDERPLFAPVFGMVDGIGALAPLAKEPAATQASSFRVGTFDTSAMMNS